MLTKNSPRRSQYNFLQARCCFRHNNRSDGVEGEDSRRLTCVEISGVLTMSKHTNRSAEQAARKKTTGGAADGRPKTKNREEVRQQHKHTSRKP